jgi:hypothetical protein
MKKNKGSTKKPVKRNTANLKPLPRKRKKVNQEPDTLDLVPGNEADLNYEDIEALGPEDLSMDLGDDEQLKHRVHPVDFTAEDLDIPGTDLDDELEDIGSEDEENNFYSQADT